MGSRRVRSSASFSPAGLAPIERAGRSTAATAGLKPGDEVIGIDGQDVAGANAYLLYSLTPAASRRC